MCFSFMKLLAPFFSFVLTDEIVEKLALFFLGVRWKFTLHPCENRFFCVLYIFWAFSPLMDRTIERERHRKWEAERGGLTRRIGPLGAGFEPGLPAVSTIASTHGACALPTELNTAPKPFLSRSCTEFRIAKNMRSLRDVMIN